MSKAAESVEPGTPPSDNARRLVRRRRRRRRRRRPLAPSTHCWMHLSSESVPINKVRFWKGKRAVLSQRSAY